MVWLILLSLVLAGCAEPRKNERLTLFIATIGVQDEHGELHVLSFTDPAETEAAVRPDVAEFLAKQGFLRAKVVSVKIQPIPDELVHQVADSQDRAGRR